MKSGGNDRKIFSYDNENSSFNFEYSILVEYIVLKFVTCFDTRP